MRVLLLVCGGGCEGLYCWPAMSTPENTIDRRRTIAEVSDLVSESVQTLRRWEEAVPQLKPKRDSAGRRYFHDKEIAIIRRIKQLHRHDKMKLAGVRVKLAEELRAFGEPQSNQTALDILDDMEAEIRRLLDLTDEKP